MESSVPRSGPQSSRRRYVSFVFLHTSINSLHFFIFNTQSTIEYSFKPFLDYINKIVPKDIWTKYDEELQLIAEPLVGDEVVRELKGIVKTARSVGVDVTLSELEYFQIFYEILMQCTGIIAKDEKGDVIHGRNMDFGVPVENITVQVNWQRKNKTVGTSTNFLGYQGVHTGMRSNQWSVQANERVILEPGPKPLNYAKSSLLLTVHAFLIERHRPLGLSLRDILLNTGETYEAAVKELKTVPLASPVYFIVGGLKNGTVLTRDRKGLAQENQDISHVLDIFPNPVPKDAGIRNLTSEFEVQTNWDPWMTMTSKDCIAKLATFDQESVKICDEWVEFAFNDPIGCSHVCMLYSDPRAGFATKMMLSKNNTGDTRTRVFTTLNTKPVLQSYTLFTSIMSASKDIYTTLVRENNKKQNQDKPSFNERTNSLRFMFRELTRGVVDTEDLERYVKID